MDIDMEGAVDALIADDVPVVDTPVDDTPIVEQVVEELLVLIRQVFPRIFSCITKICRLIILGRRRRLLSSVSSISS